MLKINKTLVLIILTGIFTQVQAQNRPNVIIIYSDDVGYGDIGCYGATKIHTPNIDKLAEQGIRFNNSHTTSSTCTPSRFALLTGEYPWRKEGTGIAAGNAGFVISENQYTLADVFHDAGYKTAAIGKWHLGLGGPQGPDWNGAIKPGPNDLGFDYSFIIPATPDRVPTVYVENRRVLNLDPKDPLQVDYEQKIGDVPTGLEHPELLKMPADKQHSGTIVNGVSRIGYMSGGKAAWWNDENMSDDITQRALNFISDNKSRPFFLYFAIQDVHVPRVPNPRFAGKSGLGARGDALLELDENTGKVLNLLDKLHLSENTIVVFSSDNGPVINDGYDDQSVRLLQGHTPWGSMKGGKYSKYDAGTRVPMIVRWPKTIKANQVSDALWSQVDLLASMADLLKRQLPVFAAPDSKNMLPVILGKSKIGRDHLVEQGLFKGLALIKGDWKYIAPSNGPAIMRDKNMETGNSKLPQLYNIKKDIGESTNLAPRYPEKAAELDELLKDIAAQQKTKNPNTSKIQ
nr:arylsulfatase [uncultured Pedobacter sp.]